MPHLHVMGFNARTRDDVEFPRQHALALLEPRWRGLAHCRALHSLVGNTHRKEAVMYRFAMGAALLVAFGATAQAQTPATQAQAPALQDPVLRQIWEQGMERSQAYRIGQALLDSVGPRLTASPGHRAANDWAVKLLQSWGIEARN